MSIVRYLIEQYREIVNKLHPCVVDTAEEYVELLDSPLTVDDDLQWEICGNMVEFTIGIQGFAFPVDYLWNKESMREYATFLNEKRLEKKAQIEMEKRAEEIQQLHKLNEKYPGELPSPPLNDPPPGPVSVRHGRVVEGDNDG